MIARRSMSLVEREGSIASIGRPVAPRFALRLDGQCSRSSVRG